MLAPSHEAEDEKSLVEKIKNKDQLIKEIDAQISRLDALDESVSKKQNNQSLAKKVSKKKADSKPKASEVEQQLRRQVSSLE